MSSNNPNNPNNPPTNRKQGIIIEAKEEDEDYLAKVKKRLKK